MKRIAIFASGDGSNAENIIRHFKGCKQILVSLIVSSKADAFVLKRAKNYAVPSLVLNKNMFTQTENLLVELDNHHIDFIVLAGFLWLIPTYLIRAYPNSIINIHPALLPKYGGKGMFGINVHRAVIDAEEKESGITIHYVNEEYDNGQIIFRKSCTIDSAETPESLAEKIHCLEHKHFPNVIEQLLIPNTT